MISQVFKYSLQFLLSSFFTFVVVFYLNPRGSMGTQIVFMLVTVPFAITAGMMIGDVSLYTTQKFSVIAVIASLILSIFGIIFSLFILDMSHKMIPGIVSFIAYFCALVFPPLVGYNFFSDLKRKKWKKSTSLTSESY